MTDMADSIRADREAGTPGPWSVGKDSEEGQGRGLFIGGGGYCRANIVGPIEHTEANARRIARVPDLEQAYLDLLAENAALREKEDSAGSSQILGLARAAFNAGCARGIEELTFYQAEVKFRRSRDEAFTEFMADWNRESSPMMGVLDSLMAQKEEQQLP